MYQYKYSEKDDTVYQFVEAKETDEADPGIYFYKIKFKDGESNMTKLVILK